VGDFAQDERMRQEFFGNGPVQPAPSSSPFRFDAMRESLQARISEDPAIVRAVENQAWSDEFIKPQTRPSVGLAQGQTQQMPRMQFTPRYSGMMPMQRDAGVQRVAQPVGNQQDWESEFAKVEQQLKNVSEEEMVKQLEEEFKEMAGEETAEDFFEKFNHAWKNGGDLETPGPTAEQTGDQTAEQLGESYWEDDYAPNPTSNLTNFDPDPVTAPLEEYFLEQENPFVDTTDPMEEGLRLWREGGQLSAAALCFEAAVQRDESNSLAWMYLGQVQAENEKEEPAIAALQKAVQLDPSNMSALMSLAVSYTNESHDMQAYATLHRWMRSAYPDIGQKDDLVILGTDVSPREVHNRVTKLFLEAARRNQSVDADVQVGLGVLFYNHGDYDKAVDCFTAALSARPEDYTLWNRLGATLANSGRSEEAIAAYDKALGIKPTFVRGRYNLGVSCINIGVYKEAAEHLLGALSMHVLPDGTNGRFEEAHRNVSQNLWDTLRRTFMLMERKDLADVAKPGTDLQAFRDAGFEF